MATRKYVKKKSISGKGAAATAVKQASARKDIPGAAKKSAAAVKKSAVRKSVAAKAATRPKAPKKAVKTEQRRLVSKPPVKSLDLEKLRVLLLEMRDRVSGQISFLADDANHKDDSPTDDRTDDFDREFALNLVSSEQDSLYEIDDALRRIQRATYGKCEYCEGSIEINRLRALPFARNCLQCQSNIEHGLIRGTAPRMSAEDSEEHDFGSMDDVAADDG